MRWTRGGQSENLEDRRAQSSLGGLGGRGGRLGLTGLLLVLGISWLTGVNPLTLLAGMQGAAPPDASGGDVATGAVQSSPEEDELVQFVSFVLDDAQGTWRSLVPNYRDAKLVLFRGAVQSGCGDAEAAMGPFYCPADEKVYIDLAFYEELSRRFGAPGDFAQAYVLAHELGHHVQHLLGTEQRVREAQQQAPRPRQRALGGPRAASGLLCRRVGPLHRAARSPRAGRSRRGAGRGLRRRRRPHPGDDDRRRAPGELHARLGERALRVLPQGLFDRRPQRLRVSAGTLVDCQLGDAG